MQSFAARSPVNFLLLLSLLQVPTAALAGQDHVQFCWAVGRFDRTIYFAEVENREDRQNSFEQLLEVSGINHLPAQCRVSDTSSHRSIRQQLVRDWLGSELEIVDTTFLSDLDY